MKNFVKISLFAVMVSSIVIGCSSVPATPNYNNDPIEPGQTEMRSQGQNNDVPEPGQTQMKDQNGN